MAELKPRGAYSVRVTIWHKEHPIDGQNSSDIYLDGVTDLNNIEERAKSLVDDFCGRYDLKDQHVSITIGGQFDYQKRKYLKVAGDALL